MIMEMNADAGIKMVCQSHVTLDGCEEVEGFTADVQPSFKNVLKLSIFYLDSPPVCYMSETYMFLPQNHTIV